MKAYTNALMQVPVDTIEVECAQDYTNLIYVAGSLRNPNIPGISRAIHAGTGRKVFTDWHAAGEHADDSWKAYYEGMGFSYKAALLEPASKHVFEFDKTWIDRSATMVLVLPAGKSGHMELGYALGKGKKGYILLDGNTDRWDVMYQFANGVANDLDELISMIQKEGKHDNNS